MGKNRAKKKTNNLKDILDSDDELPTEYIDLPFVPAYQVDNRFEYIEEKKVDKEQNKQKKELSERPPRGSSKGGLNNGRTVVASGYLNKKDRFCFQCLEPNTGKKTQQWFFNFLMIKDLHASYTFLTTCLVPSYGNDYSSGNRESFKDCNEKIIWKYKMVASK